MLSLEPESAPGAFGSPAGPSRGLRRATVHAGKAGGSAGGIHPEGGQETGNWRTAVRRTIRRGLTIRTGRGMSVRKGTFGTVYSKML